MLIDMEGTGSKLEDFIISEFKSVEEQWLIRFANEEESEYRYCICPFYAGSVLNWARYDRMAGCFVSIEANIGEGTGMSGLLIENGEKCNEAYFDESRIKTVTIKLGGE